jgi:hypothetical protein
MMTGGELRVDMLDELAKIRLEPGLSAQGCQFGVF